MASFVGTNKEFHRYIGPRLRNIVQQFTKNYKAEVSACEDCDSKGELESAHVHGRSRNEIIDILLNKNTHNGIVTVDIDMFEERFKEKHYPLKECIRILCRSCHKKYDTSMKSQLIQESQNPNDSYSPPSSALPITLKPSDSGIFKQNLLISRQAEIKETYSDGRIKRKTLPITLEPSGEGIFKSNLLISRQAEIEETYFDGEIKRKIWNATRFSKSSNVLNNLRSRSEYRTNNWQSKGIVKIHVKIIKNT